MQVGSIHPLRIIPEGVFLHSVEFKQVMVQKYLAALELLFLL
jgi:hypothetical protein